jgi:hypothetical protein
MGHLAGRPDLEGSASAAVLMAEVLPAGLRRTQALDQLFASGTPLPG